MRDAVDVVFEKLRPDYLEVLKNNSGLNRIPFFINELKKEAGEIPDYLCDTISGVIKATREAEKDAEKEDFKDVLSDLYRVENDMEKIRDDVEQLRALGKFWFKKYDELISAIIKIEDERYEAQCAKDEADHEYSI